MRGEEWNQLVAAPSVAEIDAALAEVRLRAVPIARRYDRRRALRSAAGRLLALGVVFLAGWGASGVAIPQLYRVPLVRGLAARGVPTAEAGPVAVPVSAPLEGRVRRFTVRSWLELAGERFGEDQVVVEGPPGVGMAFMVMEEARDPSFARRAVEVDVRVTLRGDSVSYAIEFFTRRRMGRSTQGNSLFEEGYAFSHVVVPRGTPARLHPFGRSSPDGYEHVIEIAGPDVAAPAGVRWDTTARFESFHGISPETRRNAEFARLAGVRWARLRSHGMWAMGTYRMPMRTLRIGVEGRGDVAYAGFPMAQRALIPGVLDTVRVIQNSRLPGTCFRIMRDDWRALERDARRGTIPFRAEGCLRPDDPWAPVTVTANTGQRLRVQMIEVADPKSR